MNTRPAAAQDDYPGLLARVRGWLGPSRDLPPRPECAPLWHAPLLAGLSAVRLTVLIGQHARAHHLPGVTGTLTEVVARWRTHLLARCPVPHPGPRNTPRLRRNPWFEQDLLPVLRQHVAQALRTVAWPSLSPDPACTPRPHPP